MIRITNGGMSRQTDVYLRDWSIKNELRNRAMVYDYVSTHSEAYSHRTCLYLRVYLFMSSVRLSIPLFRH